MAESDAAGPGSTGGPKARSLTREDLPRLVAEADREWQSLTPAERARRKAEAEKADREAHEAARRAALPTLEALERMTETARRAAQMAGGLDAGAARLGIPAGPPYEPASIPAGLGHHLPLDLSVFEFEPAAGLSAEDIRAVADAVKAALAEAKKDRKPRGETTCERLRDLHVNLDPDFAETAPERQLAKRIDRSTGTFPDSHYWRTVLKPAREKARVAKAKILWAQKWGHFDSVGRSDEGSKDH